MRITPDEWKGSRWSDGVLLAVLAVVAHGVAFVAVNIAVGRFGTPPTQPPRVAARAQAERLRFVVPAMPALAPARRSGAIGGTRAPPRVTTDTPRGAPGQSSTDTATSVASETPGAPHAVGSTEGALATPLPVDPRLEVTPGSANNAIDTRVRDVNIAIASRVRALADSVARARRRWTVGVDTTHRFGIANCGIVVDVICIPFGFHGMPNPASASSGIDLKHAADEADVRAAIGRIRTKDSKSNKGGR